MNCDPEALAGLDAGLLRRRLVSERSRRPAAIVALHARADAANLARARRVLEDLLRSNADLPELWNDLGAVLVLQHDLGAPEWDLFRAVESLRRAIELAPAQSEPYFNLALCDQELGLPRRAHRRFGEALAREPDRAWRTEIEDRRSELSGGSGDSCEKRLQLLEASDLASGQAKSMALACPWKTLQYLLLELLPDLFVEDVSPEPGRYEAGSVMSDALAAKGSNLARELMAAARDPAKRSLARQVLLAIAHIDDQRFSEAEELLRDVLAERRSASPIRELAELSLARIVIRRDHEETAELLEHVEGLDGSRYAYLVGEAFRIHGILLGRARRYADATLEYQKAIETLRRTFGAPGVAFIWTLMAEASDLQGRFDASWSQHVRGLRALDSGDEPARLHSALESLGAGLTTRGLYRAAAEVMDEAVLHADQWGNAYAKASSHRKLGTALTEVGLSEPGFAEFALAASAIRELRDPDFRELIEADQLMAEAVARRVEPSTAEASEALERLHRVVAIFQSRDLRHDETNARLQLARALRAAGDPRQATEQLEQVTVAYDALQDVLSPTELRRASTLQETALQELAYARLELGDRRGAIQALDRSRWVRFAGLAGSWGQSVGEVTPGPADAALFIDSFEGLIYLWVVTPTAITVNRSVASSAETEKLARSLSGLHGDELTHALSGLGRALLPTPLPVGTIAIVPDDSTRHLPFHALIHADSGKHLIEMGEVLVLPTLQIRRSRRDSPRRSFRLVVVGGPGPGMPALPHAREEAMAVATAGDDVRLLEQPGPDQLLELLAGSTWFHFAGHLVGDPLVPHRQRLDLGGGNRLYIDQIRGLDLQDLDLVVLSSCDSAAGVMGVAAGPSFSEAFLHAGAAAALGTVWPVADRAAYDFVMSFYEQTASGRGPEAAFQSAVLEAMGSSWPPGAPPAWMAYRLDRSTLEAVDERPARPGAAVRERNAADSGSCGTVGEGW